jgi:hypothetical protein
MLEVDRANLAFAKTNSQTTSRLMTLTMLNEGPYRMLNQCLAQIENKRAALKENTFKIKKEILEVKRLELNLKFQQTEILKLERELNSSTCSDSSAMEFKLGHLKIDLEKTSLDIAEKITQLADSTNYYEAALKEIAIYQESYEEIRKNNHIPENWDEVDYEKAEAKAHVKTGFRLALRDLEMTGRLNCATMEYFEQFGINPMTAKNLVMQYYHQQQKLMEESPDQPPMMPTIHMLNQFLEEMTEIFKDSYKEAMKIRGITTHISEWAAFTKQIPD